MPAINIVCGHRRVDTLADAAFCDPQGIIVRIVSRTLPSRMSDGLILAHDLAGLDLPIARHFERFDDAVEGIECALSNASVSLKSPCLFYLAGWSEKREETEAYAISTHPVTLSSWQPDTREQAELRLASCELTGLPPIFLSPAPDPSAVAAASIGRFDTAWRTDKMLSELGKVIRAQRHSQQRGHLTVGGFAEGRRVDVNWGGIWLSPHPPEIVWQDDRIGRRIVLEQSDDGIQASAASPSAPRFFLDLKDRLSTWPATIQFVDRAFSRILDHELAAGHAHVNDSRYTDSSLHNIGKDELAAVACARALNLHPSDGEMDEYDRYVDRVLGDLERMKDRFRLEQDDPHGYGIATLHGISRKLTAILRD